nr:hypothetical protein YSBCXYJI_YSBCXYJI_CDS_0031 [Caudoviricetes sp.]DAI22710.1 MAG TPA: hypothetical protein [Caudoviricetes sp.]
MNEDLMQDFLILATSAHAPSPYSRISDITQIYLISYDELATSADAIIASFYPLFLT